MQWSAMFEVACFISSSPSPMWRECAIILGDFVPLLLGKKSNVLMSKCRCEIAKLGFTER